MDYDDNQHAPRNIQLDSEDNNNFPPGLRSYPLPKFDLDEHFEVPVEFDSLGERGILLDLPSRTGDHWIDDYSRDDNSILILDPVSESIEFGNAEKSCTIPRKSNVWSEAASSESVEILLNSVGQDEMATKKGDAEKSDVCDTHVPLSEQMDTGACGDDSAFKTSNVSYADPRVSPDNSLISSSSLEKHDWKDVSIVKGMPENVIDNHHEHQEHGHLTTNELHEKEGSSLNNSSKQCSSITESFQHSTVDFPLDSKRCCDEDAHMKHVSSQQVEGSLLGECPLHVEYVNIVKEDAECCTPAISNKGLSERLVNMQAVSPTMQSDISEKLLNSERATYHTREVSENDLCQRPQATVIADGDNDDTKQFPSVQAEIINHPVEDEFVDRKSNQVGETHYVEESSIIAGTPSLVKEVSASGKKTESTHDLVSLDISCRMVHMASAEEVILDLDPQLPKEVADAQAGNSKVTPAIVNDFSELLTGQSPASSESMAHSNVGLHSLISFSEDASQQSHCTKPCENDPTSSHTDIVKADISSNPGPKVSTSRDSLAMKNTGQSPGSFAVEDTGQSEMVMMEICTSESLAKAKCLPNACINQEVSQIKSKSGVISICASSCSEGTLQKMTEGVIASNKEDTEQKEEKPDLPGSGETGNQGTVASDFLDMPVDGESQLATKDDLVSVSGKHACLSVGAVPDLLVHSSAPLQYSTNNVQHSNLVTSEAEKATRHNSLKRGSSDSFPSLVEQTGSSAVFEVSLKKSEFSDLSVADKQSGEDEQLKHPIVFSAPSMSNTSSSKGPTSEAGILLSGEDDRQDCSHSIDIQSCPSAQADVTLACSSESGFKEACLDDMELTRAPISVGASNSVKGGSCNPEVLKTDTDPCKVDNDGKVAADCGSPTIISCKESHEDEAHHDEMENQSLPRSPPSGNTPGVSSSTTGQSDGMKASDQNPDTCDTPESDKSFTFKIGNLSGSSLNEKSGKDWKQFSSIGPTELFQTTGSAEGTSDINPQVRENKRIEASKSRSKIKSRSRSGNETERATTGKGKPKKDSSSRKLTSMTAGNDKLEGNASAGPSKSALGSPIQLEESKRLAHVEGSTTKPYSMTSVASPVLNAFASSASALFQQPFTDMQQLQLRAQIFVYGYLIRGAAPDEACMVSAFGETGRDGGRNMWENVWRISVERAHSQKPLPASPEISPIIHSGVRVTDQSSRGNSGPNKSSVVSASRNTNKSSPVAILNPAVSLPSPIWNSTPSSRDLVQSRASLIDPHSTFAPYHLYSSPQIRPFTGHFSSWPSQVSSPVSWILSHTSALDAGSQYAAFSTPDTLQVTPVRDQTVLSSVNVTPNVQVATSMPLPSTVSSTATAANVPVDVKKTTVASPVDVKKATFSSVKQPSADQKPRKRRKSVPSEDNQLLNVQQPQAGSISSAVVNTHVSAPLSLTAASTPSVSAVSMSKTSSGDPVSLSPTALLTSNYHIFDHGAEKRAAFSEEVGIQVEQAKLRAEDAAALAASAARHSQELWNQLTVHKNSILATDVEGSLSSALASAAAAASVAKAAAAAAKVAADAALQAKLMADEALTEKKMVAGCGTDGGISEVGKFSANVTPALVSKGKVRQGNISSVVEFAKEAARKGVEAASAATQRAQNLDAVVKAAGLAAEAISQATAIVAMGDPLPLTLNQLLESGPEGYWKHQDVVSRFSLEPTAKEVKHSGEITSLNVKVSFKNDVVQGAKGTNTNISEESLGGTTKDGLGLVNSTHQEVDLVEIASKRRQRAHKTSGLAIARQTIPSLEFQSQNTSLIHFDGPEKSVHHDSSEENWIQQGSLVEVISDEDGLRAVWFSAKVSEVKEGKAYVCYNDLLSDEGMGQLKEWIPLEAADGKPPRIRVAHPMTAVQFEGTRKRHRAAMENRNWSVGDHVDAWMRDGWWEGVIMERFKEDETKLTVHFPAEGDVSAVRTWNVRPSLVWKDGQWVEWSRETASWLNEDDAPLDKRQKLDKKLENDVQNQRNEGSRITKCDDPTKQQNSTSFALASNVFSVGKSTSEDHDLAGRVKRTGLQKGGSRVVFGVPKPGKKRKFMDVSKHYITEQVGKGGGTNNPVKVANYLMPRGSSRLRNVSKDVPKSGRGTNTRYKDVKSGKLQEIQRKNISKDDSSMSALPPSVGATEDGPHLEPSASNAGNSERQNRREIGFSDAAGEQDSDEILSRNKPFSVRVRQLPKRKLASAGQGLSSNEAVAATGRQGKAALEPRRSNRRIQPTSRLLEGLQSSLITTKVSSGGLHDKGGKSSKKSASTSVKGNSHGGER